MLTSNSEEHLSISVIYARVFKEMPNFQSETIEIKAFFNFLNQKVFLKMKQSFVI